METTQKKHPAAAFSILARLEPGLRLPQVRSVFATFDGSRVILNVTDPGERIAEKRALGTLLTPAGCHAIDLYDRRTVGETVCEIFVGTEGITENSALEAMLAGVGTLLDREGRTNLVCGVTADTHCYVRVKRNGTPSAWADLTSEFGAVEIAYVPGAKVYIARKPDSNMLGVLPIEVALEGKFGARHWSFVAVPGANAVTGLQPRIITSRAVMVHIMTEDAMSATVAYNFEMIGVGKIEAEADALSRTSPWVRFRGFVNGGDVALVQNTATIDVAGLAPGINLVPTNALPEIFGLAARQLIVACVKA